MWFFLLFRIITDVFRDRELSGWAKAGWMIFCIVLPFLGVFVYVIVRGKGMGERDAEQTRRAQEAFQDYVRKAAAPAAGTASGTDELARLAELHASGALTDQEFERAKTKLLS
ncbi:SHOCT domain-containing protein [Streptomyces sp. SID8379]|nr:SHOCT domain-containing protein [Streptomyces sp. SID8379]MYW70119.1 SHOCT domain-containing protein [Streptomyces sp. SID8379]